MLNLDQIRAELQDRNIMKVHKATGVGYQTIRNIRDDAASNPTHNTLAALSEYLEARRAAAQQ